MSNKVQMCKNVKLKCVSFIWKKINTHLTLFTDKLL